MKLTKEFVKSELNLKKSIRQIARENNVPNKTLHYWINKWNFISNYNKPIYNEHYFNKVNTKEKAYILGFILGDSSLTEKSLEITIAKKDIGFLELVKEEIGCNIKVDNTFDKKSKRYPRARVHIANSPIIKDLKMLFGGFKKEERHIPIIKKSLQKYLVLGFFDAEGCLTFGIRKDRNKLWKKVFFTSQLKMLEGIQNILINWEISSSIKKRKTSNCYDLYIRTKDVDKLINKIYNLNINSLTRKQLKIKALLRHESDENGENS